MPKIHVCLLIILIISILLQAGCITMTSIASKQIQESKYSYELMKNSPVMSKDRKDFSRDIIVKLNGQEQILMTGLYISALILTLLIFRGIVISMILISKGSSRTDKTSKILSTASASYTLSYTCPICMDSYQSLTNRGKLDSYSLDNQDLI